MKRLGIILISIGVLFAGLLAVFLAHTAEPSYQGHTLSEWVNAAWIKSPAMRPTKFYATPLEAVVAIKSIGSNAIPTLLRWSQLKPSTMKSRLNSLLDRQRLVTFRFETVANRQIMAGIAFNVLGTDALPAVTALEKILQRGDLMGRLEALDCLVSIDAGTGQLLPVFLRALHNSDPAIQRSAARYLGTTYPADADRAGAFKLFPEFTPYQPKAVASDPPSEK